jgi:hypothetical protein
MCNNAQELNSSEHSWHQSFGDARVMDASNVTKEQLSQAFERIIPKMEDRRVMCSQLLKTISYCSELGSGAWSVSLLQSGFRVNVGQVEVMTCFYTHWDPADFESLIQVDQGFLDFRFLVSGPHVNSLIDEYPDSVAPASYRSVQAPHWVVNATLHVEGDRDGAERAKDLALMDAAQLAHRHFVVAAAHAPGGALRKRSNFARFHCESIVTYARELIVADTDGSTRVDFRRENDSDPEGKDLISYDREA